MKFTLVGYGTRGDVQPYACVGFELAKRGHEVTLCAPENMRDFVEKSGLRYAPLPIDARAMLLAPEAQQMLANGRFTKFMKWMNEEERKARAGVNEGLYRACAGADRIVSHPLVGENLLALSEHFGKELIPLYLYPVMPSSRYASIFLTTKNLGPLNGFSHLLTRSIVRNTLLDGAKEQRRSLGMPPPTELLGEHLTRKRLRTLFSFSPRLFPRPSDWPENALSCSGIAMPEELKARLGEQGLPDDLKAWLTSGSPPIYIGFGSMPVLDAARMLAMTRHVLGALDVRAVIGAGWSDLAPASDPRIRIVGAIDHAALFGHCRGAVHHGGAGTTYASLLAGLPTLICSVFADQPFWGSRVEKLGVGATIPFRKLTAARLEAGLRRLLDEGVQARARALGAALREERGVHEVADALIA